jgi:CRP/FNR family transcriptional regulator, cyclic AMP receptor protein
MDQKVELLSKVPLLAGLDRKELEQVAQICDEIDLPAGRVIVKQGASAAEFFVVITGTCSVERDGQHVRDLGSGEFFGEMALLADIPRTATVTVIAAGRFLVLGHREFHSLLSQYPTIQTAVLHAVASRLTAAEGDPPN